jgi:hypothetical protein
MHAERDLSRSRSSFRGFKLAISRFVLRGNWAGSHSDSILILHLHCKCHVSLLQFADRR